MFLPHTKDMPFKLFQKKETTEKINDESSNLVPASPKVKLGGFSLKPPNTPTLTAGSLRGEQKRTGLLEFQLKEVSLTASKAYDKVEDLTLQNKMLEDQVQQQKELLETFARQLEEANAEKKQFRQIQEDALKNKLKERNHDAEKISKLVHERDLILIENKRLKEEIEKLHQMYNDNLTLVSELQNKHKKEVESKQNLEGNRKSQNSTNIQSSPEQQQLTSQSQVEGYKKLIYKLENKINQLESTNKMKDQNYQQSITALKQSIDILRQSKSFLDHPNKSTVSHSSRIVETPYEDNVLDRGDGSTYILENISFH